jgi:RNA polymerase sigma-70 factor (ECF subfamily)
MEENRSSMSGKAMQDPEQLVVLARAGDDLVRGQLLEQFRNYLTMLARLQIGRRLQGKVDASDLVQETFLEAHRDFKQFRGTTERELTGWLRQILASNLANFVQRYCGTQRRAVHLERELAAELDQSSRCLDLGLAARHSTPSHQASRREQAVLLANALEELPQDYRDVLVLRHLEELTFPEVARRMGRSLDSVKNLWARALGRLRRVLGGLSWSQ